MQIHFSFSIFTSYASQTRLIPAQRPEKVVRTRGGSREEGKEGERRIEEERKEEGKAVELVQME